MAIRNLKTHLVSIAIISAVIVVVYAVFAPHDVKSGTQNQLRGDRYIQIDSASWGLNCNPFIDDALRDWKPSEDPITSKRNPKPHHVSPDNVLTAFTDACNGKLTCDISATSEALGDEPMTNCPKLLELRYRCSTFEPLIIKQYSSGHEVQLDCQPK